METCNESSFLPPTGTCPALAQGERCFAAHLSRISSIPKCLRLHIQKPQSVNFIREHNFSLTRTPPYPTHSRARALDAWASVDCCFCSSVGCELWGQDVIVRAAWSTSYSITGKKEAPLKNCQARYRFHIPPCSQLLWIQIRWPWISPGGEGVPELPLKELLHFTS